MPEWPPTPAACSYSCFPGTASTSSYLFLDLIAQPITFTGAASISHDVKAQSIITCHTTSSHPSYAFAQKGRAKFSSLVFPVPCCPCPFQFILASCLLFFPFHVAPCSLLFLPSHVPQLLFAFLSMSCPPPPSPPYPLLLVLFHLSLYTTAYPQVQSFSPANALIRLSVAVATAAGATRTATVAAMWAGVLSRRRGSSPNWSSSWGR